MANLLKNLAGQLRTRKALRKKYGKDIVIVGDGRPGVIILPRKLTPEAWRQKYPDGISGSPPPMPDELKK